MYNLGQYGQMLADRVRMEPYVAAMKRCIHADSVVLDIGAGTGIFALIACRLGARRVFAVEPNENIAVARTLAAANGFGDRMSCLQEDAERVELPCPVDVIVSDLRGVLPLSQRHIPVIIDARERHLAPGGRLIPESDTLWAAVAEAPELRDKFTRPWENELFDIDLSAALALGVNSWGNVGNPERLLVDPQPWATLTYASIDDANVRGELEWTAAQAGRGHGISVWFETQLAGDIGFSTGPQAPENVYGNAFFPWPEPVDIHPGDTISLMLAAALVAGDYVWRWETRVVDGAARIKADFRQSDFFGRPLCTGSLHRSATTHQPTLNEDAHIDLAILRYLQSGDSLGEISECIRRRFPRRFASAQHALTRVGALSRRYTV